MGRRQAGWRSMAAACWVALGLALGVGGAAGTAAGASHRHRYDDDAGFRPHAEDAPASLSMTGNSRAFLFPRLPQVFNRLEPAATAARPDGRYHSLRALSVDAYTGHVHWVLAPCDPEADISSSGSGSGQSKSPCLSSLTSVHLLRQVLGDPACGPGIGFTLDPFDPTEPLGPYFRKTFHPPQCADLWSDLLPGAVLFQADWDLKLLLHDVDGIAGGLGGWYRTIEQLSRERDLAPPVGQEVLGKVWLTAAAVEVAESRSSLAFGRVVLEMRAAAVRRDPGSPTGLAEAAGQPPPAALAAFVARCNAHMEELVAHLPSFQYLQQLVVAQEAARFLADRGIRLSKDAALDALRSPLTGLQKVPALHLERKRSVDLLGAVVRVDDDLATDTTWLRRLGSESDGGGGGVFLGAGSSAVIPSTDYLADLRVFRCGVRNATLAGLGSLEALFASGAAFDCKEERLGGGPWAAWGQDGPANDGDGSGDDPDVDEAGAEEDSDAAACAEALAVWLDDTEEWRVWPSEPAPPRPPPEKQLQQQEEEAEDEGAPLPPMTTYNVTGRLVLFGGQREAAGSRGGAVVLLAREGQKGLAEAVGREEVVGLVLISEEDDSNRKRAKRRDRRLRRQERAQDYAAHLPVRVVGHEAGEELAALVRRTEALEGELGLGIENEDDKEDERRGGGLRVWMACGVERDLAGGGGGATGEEEEEDEGGQAAGPREFTYDGLVYRTLDLAPVEGSRVGCQEAALPIPDGFEIAPAYPAIVEQVVKPHPWGTGFLLLRATAADRPEALAVPLAFAAYGTAVHGRRAGKQLGVGTELVEATTSEEDDKVLLLQPSRCEARILLRQVATTVAYGGYLYRALEPNVPVDALEVPPGAPPPFAGLAAVAAQLPPGWELSPANRGIAQQVAAGHPWGTDVLIMADGQGYPTQLYYHRKELLRQQQQQQGGGGSSRSFAPYHRVLIRQPIVLGQPGDGAAQVEYRVGDTYRADASARLELRRLGQPDNGAAVAYLLEVEVTERVMIHGGVDLASVRRVAMPAGGGGGGSGSGSATESAEASFLASLDRAVGSGSIGGKQKQGGGGKWTDGEGETFSVLTTPAGVR